MAPVARSFTLISLTFLRRASRVRFRCREISRPSVSNTAFNIAFSNHRETIIDDITDFRHSSLTAITINDLRAGAIVTAFDCVNQIAIVITKVSRLWNNYIYHVVPYLLNHLNRWRMQEVTEVPLVN